LYANNDCVVLPDRRIDFVDLERASRRLAKQLLAAGVGKGSRVGIHLPTGPLWAVVFVAVTRIGAIAMPFSTLYRPEELRQALRVGDVSVLISVPSLMGKDHESFLEQAIPGLADSRPANLFARRTPYLRSVWLLGEGTRSWATHAEISTADAEESVGGFDDAMLEAIEAEVTPADAMVAVFTSGTTAAPKAVIHSQGAAIRKTSPAANGSLNAQFGGRVLSLMPFFWVGGLQELLSALQSGAAVVTLERLDAAAAVELGVREEVTGVMGNAAAMRSILGTTELRDVIPTIRPIPQRPWAGGPSSRGDASVAIGMTETFGPWNSVYGMECRIVNPDTGEICAEGESGEFQVRGYALMQALYKQEADDTFTKDGFYATGDLGFQENERFYFTARLKDLIKTKGANVAPAEVEAVLNEIASVRMSFVVGLPHPVDGEQVVAGVVVEDGMTLDTDGVLAQCRARLSSYKVPRVIEVLDRDEIPYLSSSKPDRLAIKDLLDARCRGEHMTRVNP
jgi:acyl-CoA synthetase (AMP-forming)/AMP-acid ligase II